MKFSKLSALTIVCIVAVVAVGQDQVGPSPAPSQVSTSTATTSAVASRAPTTQYDCGDPTADEQLVLEYINRARANPTAEGTRLGINITEGLTAAEVPLVQVRPPLAMNKTLLSTARTHSQDMYTNNYFAHTDLQGKDPFQRITAAGYTFNSAGENIATGSSNNAVQLEDLLMVDAGISDRGHRLNLLSIYDTSTPVYREVGIGEFDGSTPNPSGFKNFQTQDFGASSTGPFIVGVVYNDANGNGFYDKGEGVAGITIMPDVGTFYAVSSTTGGYAIPVPASGTITLTASGGSLATPIVKQITMAGVNVKVDFNPSGGGTGTGTGTSTSTDTGTSTGTGTGTGTSPTNLVIAKFGVKLNLLKPSMDSITFSGTLPIVANQGVAGTVSMSIGTIQKSLTLSSKGMGVSGTDSFKLRVKTKKGVVLAQAAPFAAKFMKGSYATALAANGLTGTSASVSIPITLTYAGLTYQVVVSKTYTSNGKIGTAK